MAFIEEISSFAVKYMKQEGILASLTLAQAILESDFGQSELAVKANNLFGMKAHSTWKGPVYQKKTKEFSRGKWVEGLAVFCKFASVEECIEYRSTVFLKKAQYKPLWGVTDYKEACRIIWQCGYATDPNYPQKLIDVIEKYKLYEFDNELKAMPERGESASTDTKKEAALEELQKEAIRLGITDGKNSLRKLNQFYTWAATVPLVQRVVELEKKLKG
ncbi:flagellum-specific peptidoglycan hydrolase FlgJ [Cytobacillus eiseniae]|uniref:Flagellum-specific peptidoglycan hydrolase FlgJ n=1 Tax=Cytobacillus eiseniae TaxID=762947 RepID=A0ABS4RBZ0_9BACI|nr:glucosaminidase domain-containing protein [Cytobacillus eiseniae]MBP2239906.1 flagellum-specific peptidoglycan hydrolase FlgJ [Cytobacillus eiseniae]